MCRCRRGRQQRPRQSEEKSWKIQDNEMCKPFHARFSPYGGTLIGPHFFTIKPAAAAVKRPEIIAGGDSPGSHRRKGVCEDAPVPRRRFASDQSGFKKTIFQCENVEPSRRLRRQNAGFQLQSKHIAGLARFAGLKPISKYALQNYTCILVKSDYLKLEILDTRYQSQPPGTASMTPIRAGRSLEKSCFGKRYHDRAQPLAFLTRDASRDQRTPARRSRGPDRRRNRLGDLRPDRHVSVLRRAPRQGCRARGHQADRRQ